MASKAPSVEDQGALNVMNLYTELTTVFKWFQLGIRLGLQPFQLHQIKQQFYPDIDHCKVEMVNLWLQSTPGASWRHIVTALKESGDVTTAERIQLKYVKGARADSYQEGMSKTAAFAIANRQVIDKKFADFLTNVCNKMLKNGVNTREFRFFVAALLPPGDCIPQSPTDVTEVFEAITHHRLWDSLHYSPLVQIARNFGAGDPDMKAWIRDYKKDVKAYTIVASIEDFIEFDLDTCTDQSRVGSAKYYPRYNCPVEWMEGFVDHFIKHLTEVWEIFSAHHLVPDSPPKALLDRITGGHMSMDAYEEKVAKVSIEDKEYFEEAMNYGYVECTSTTCAVTGAAGTGKTHTMYLALNEDPPDVRQSTGLVGPVRALSTVVGVGSSESDSLEWSRVKGDKLLDIVAGATSVPNAKEQPTVQTSPSPLEPSEESFSTSLPLATPQDMHLQEQPESSSEAEISNHVSKSEQASHTEVIDDVVTKLAGLLTKPVGKRQVAKLDFLYFLDSGGQPQFHELLPSFVPNLSAIVFVVKLSEKLGQCPVIEYYKEGKSVCSYQSPYSHEQILKHCIRALQPEKRSTESGSSSSPRVAVVGTYRDEESECEGETREEKNQKLLDLLERRFGSSLIYFSNTLDELIYPVNAKNPNQEDRAVAGKLRKAIIRYSKPKPDTVPLPWFMLEQVLRKLAEDRGTGVIHIDKCREIASKLHIKHSAFDSALRYLVRLNVFLHYPDVLPDVVFCVPQVFLDIINALVQWRHILCGGFTILPQDVAAITRALCGKCWLRFRDYGLIQEELLHDEDFSTHYDKDFFTPADFLKLLEVRFIVGKVKTTDTPDIHTEYVMPSLLFELESDKLDEYRCNPQGSPAAPLLVHFPHEWPTSGVFCSLIASLLSTENWDVMTDASKKPTCLYRNCFQFRHPNMPGSITLIDSFNQGYFEVHVGDNAPLKACRDFCPEIQRSVFDALPPKAVVQAEVAFFCPRHYPSTLHLADMNTCDYWHCSEDPGKVYGVLAEETKMRVWGISTTSASEAGEHICQNPVAGDQQSESAGRKLANRPEVYQLMKLKGKEGRTVKVIEGVAAEWKWLAYTLQFSPAVVRTVRCDFSQDCTGACEEVLYRWVSGAEGTRQPVSWATLIECLKDCDFIKLASDLKDVLGEH